MKRKIGVYLFVVVLMVSLGLVPVSSVGANSVPVIEGLWHFDEGTGSITADASGQGNIGYLGDPTTVGDAAEPTWEIPGKFGNALSFDGVNDYVDATLLNISSGATVTLSFWGKPEAIAGQGVGIMIGSAYGFGWDGPGNRWWVLRSGVANYYGTTNEVPANTWAHFIAVVTSSSTNVYINGSSDGSAAVGHNGGTVLIGKRNTNIQYFKGIIDEVRIWDGALTADQIALSASGSVGWLPPVTNEDFVLQDGTTLPLKFQIFDDSGLVKTVQSVFVEVTIGTTVHRYDLGDGVTNLRWNADEYSYIANLKTKDGTWSAGSYMATVIVNEVIVNPVQYFDLSPDKGVGRGNSGKP